MDGCWAVWYPVVLVGGDCNEAGLWEGECAEVAVSIYLAVSTPVNQHHMQPRLVPVHGVQYHLDTSTNV